MLETGAPETTLALLEALAANCTCQRCDAVRLATFVHLTELRGKTVTPVSADRWKALLTAAGL